MEIKVKFKPNPEYHLMDQVREVHGQQDLILNFQY